MKQKRTIILVSIALLGLLYVFLWGTISRQFHATFWCAGGPSASPEELAQEYPLVSAALWLHRVDFFRSYALEYTYSPREVMPHYFLRHICVALSVSGVAMILLLQRPFTRRKSRRLARVSQIILFISVLLGLALLATSLVGHGRRLPKWDRTRDSNIINFRSQYVGVNADIELPVQSSGLVLIKTAAEDLHLDMDRRGWLSICGVPMSLEQMEGILKARSQMASERGDSLRLLMWADYRCAASHRAGFLQLATRFSDAIYYVVTNDAEPFPNFLACPHTSPPLFDSANSANSSSSTSTPTFDSAGPPCGGTLDTSEHSGTQQ